MQEIEFGAVYLEMDFSGSAKVNLANQKFKISTGASRHIQHQLLLAGSKPIFELSEISDEFVLESFDIRVVRY